MDAWLIGMMDGRTLGQIISRMIDWVDDWMNERIYGLLDVGLPVG